VDLNDTMSLKIMESSPNFKNNINDDEVNYVISKQESVNKRNSYQAPDHENCNSRYNTAVQQYESLLKTINDEFKTLMKRN
jgi:hypothetical protein